MKQIVCEMCGGTELIKEDGVFVCQSCGMKYSLEEARKMMIEGTVDVQGTVKVDNSAFVQKYLANARRAKEKEDWEETEKYYNMVEQNDPDNIEAIFYSAYGKAKTALTDSDVYKRAAVFKVLTNCISVVDDHYKQERKEENEAAIKSMAIDLGKMICSNFVFTEWKNGYGTVTKTNKGETISMFGGLLSAFKNTLDNIQRIDDQPYLHEAAISLYRMAMATDYWKKDSLQNWIDEEKHELLISNYWTEHVDEKKTLDDEKNVLETQIKSLESQIASLPESCLVDGLTATIDKLKAQQDALGMLKLKERRAIQDQINPINDQLTKAYESKARAAKPYNEQIDAIKAKISDIEKKLRLGYDFDDIDDNNQKPKYECGNCGFKGGWYSECPKCGAQGAMVKI